jgi:hypothetical protein
VLVVLAGCGGENSRDDYADQANEICREGQRKVNEIERPSSPEEAASFFERAQRTTAQTLAEVREVDPPEQDRAKVDRLLGRIEEANELLPALGRAIADRDNRALGRITERFRAISRETLPLARELKLSSCVSEPESG